MKELKLHLLGGAAATALLLGGCGSSTAGFLVGGQSPAHAVEQSTQLQQENGDEAEDSAEGPDEPITGDALDKASAAALRYVGEGRVTDTEVGDEDGYYEIEITLENGRQVDVHLDENFDVLGQEADGDEVDD